MPWTTVAALAVHITTQSIAKRDFLNSGDIPCVGDALRNNEKNPVEKSLEKKKTKNKINYLDYL